MRISKILLLCMLPGLMVMVSLPDHATAQAFRSVPYLHNNGTYTLVERKTMKPVTSKVYRSLSTFDGRIFTAKTIDKKYLFLNTQGKPLFNRTYDRPPSDFRNGYARLRTQNGEAFLDSTGREILLPAGGGIFISYPSEGTLIVMKRGLYGLISFDDGNEIAPPVYKNTSEFACGVIAMCDTTGHWTLLNKAGKSITNQAFEEILTASEGRIAAKWKGRWGYINTAGEELIAPQFERVSPFVGGKAAVKKEGTWVLINDKGTVLKTITKDSLDSQGFSTDGLASNYRNGLYGAINREGRQIIAPSSKLPILFHKDFQCAFSFKAYYIELSGREYRDAETAARAPNLSEGADEQDGSSIMVEPAMSPAER